MNDDLHGSAPHKSRVALILIDVVNAMDFPTGKKLAKHAAPAANKILALKQRAKAANVPVVYANDNYGRWRSDFRATLQRASLPEMPGHDVSLLLAPDDDDYFVLKPKHSAFYGSSLELLLTYFGCRRVVLAGFAGDRCVRFTAEDAFLRDYEVIVASDGIASEEVRANREALAYMRTYLGVQTKTSARIDFRALKRARGS
jgi:nicotinamidase-related amidase